MFDHQGPVLEVLLQRLAQTPQPFLEEPRIGRQGKVHVGAVVSDLLVALGGKALSPAEAVSFTSTGDDLESRNRLRLTLLSAWLFYDDGFKSYHQAPKLVLDWLQSDSFQQLAALVKVSQVISDSDRREEFARRALRALNLRPAGETAAQAADRLTTLDSVIQQQVLAASRQAEKRAQEVREAMRRKEAERSVPKYSRE